MKKTAAQCMIFAVIVCGGRWAGAAEFPEVTNTQVALHGEFAQVHGVLTSAGGDTGAAVRVYFGRTDGGTNTSVWGSTVELGMFATGSVSAALLDLDLGTQYFFRLWASNSVGHAWAGSSSTFTTPGGHGFSLAELQAIDVQDDEDMNQLFLQVMQDRNAERCEILEYLESNGPLRMSITNWATWTSAFSASYLTNAASFEVTASFDTDISSPTDAFRSILHLWWENDADSMFAISDVSGAKTLGEWGVDTNRMLGASLLTEITVLMTTEQVAYDGTKYVAVLGRMQAPENPRSNMISFAWLAFKETEDGYLFTHDLSQSMMARTWDFGGLTNSVHFQSYSNALLVGQGSEMPAFFFAIEE